MKHLLVGLIISFSASAFAQESMAPGTPAAASKLVWETNLKKAIDASIKEKKPLFLFFTGSDWCGVCKKLQNEVFNFPQFEEWSKKVVLVELDYPRNKKPDPELEMQNAPMKEMFGVTGYPTCVLVTPTISNGQVYYTRLGNIGYRVGGPDPWITEASQFLPK